MKIEPFIYIYIYIYEIILNDKKKFYLNTTTAALHIRTYITENYYIIFVLEDKDKINKEIFFLLYLDRIIKTKRKKERVGKK